MTHATSHAPAKPFRHHLVALCCLALLAACDFGGGSGGDGSDTVVTAAPAISQHPVDVQVVAGGSAQFSVVAAGDGLVYQWQRSADGGATWAAVAGAAASTLATGALTQADDGQLFRVVVSSGAASTVSSAARLQVSAVASAPAITAAPSAQQAVAGGGASFAVTASGTDLAYQWQRSTDDGATWADIAGATAPTLHLTELAASADGQLVRAVVSNSAGSLATDAVRLTVQAAGAEPVIATQPTAVAVVAPQPATFTVAASGQPAPSYQWQRSTDGGATWADIAGATAASYNTGATSVGDNGVLVRVRVSNNAGSVTSEARQLGVSAAASAPAVGQQPQDASVAAGQVVTLSAAVTGTPTPTLQWQLSTDGGTTWLNLNGATGSSYGFAAAASDNGRQYRLVASNSAGTVASRAAVLTVTAASALAGRSWTAAQSLEENVTATPISSRASTIDDAGRVTAVFVKSDGTRDRVYAVRGTPGTAGEAPSWTAPVAIDNGPLMVGDRYLSVASAPGGDVVAVWTGQGPCTADTYLTGCSYVQYVYLARYSVSTGTWSAPEAVTNTPTLVVSNPTWLKGIQTWINDRGDLTMLMQSWVAGASVGSTNRYVPVPAIFMRSAGESAFRRQVLADSSASPLEDVQIDMDDAGHLLMGAKLRRNGIADIVAYRGTVAAGLGQPVSLEDRTDNAVLAHAKLGRNGQQAVAWYFLNSDLNAYAATSANATDAFDVRVIDDAWPGNGMVITDAGQVVVYSIGGDMDKRLTWTAQGGWVERRTAQRTGESFMGTTETAVSRNGLVLNVRVGTTTAYDLAADGPEISPQSPATRRYVLGFANGTVGYAKPLVSVSGIGFVDMLNGYTTLPTATTAGTRHPSDTSGTATNALWGAFLK